MAAVETLEKIHNQAEGNLAKVISEKGYLGTPPEAAFGCTFGRDAAISSIFALITFEKNPNNRHLLDHVRNSLRTLANSQGRFFDRWRDEEPGRIVHELREENDVPTNMTKLADLKASGWPVESGLRYYGSVDSTPLFLIATCEYLQKTGDWQFAEEIDENIRLAVDWMRFYGDSDNDFYIEYSAQNRHALLNQGWMDSSDSLKHQDGTRPKEPIALVEVQGYQYLALKLVAQLYADADEEFARQLLERAEALKAKFNRDFWMPNEGYFASALDGDKRQVIDIRSNVGHLLMAGIIADDKIPLVVERLLQPDMFTEAGIRTLSANSPNFSDQAPTGYHNGAIWPHDNVIIYLGLLKYGYTVEAERVKDAVLGAQKKLADQDGQYDRELYMMDRYSILKPYETSQHPQGWVVNANLLWTAELASAKQAA